MRNLLNLGVQNGGRRANFMQCFRDLFNLGVRSGGSCTLFQRMFGEIRSFFSSSPPSIRFRQEQGKNKNLPSNQGFCERPYLLGFVRAKEGDRPHLLGFFRGKEAL